MMPISGARAELPSYRYASRAAALLVRFVREESVRVADPAARRVALHAIEDALHDRRRRIRTRRLIVIVVAATTTAVCAGGLALS